MAKMYFISDYVFYCYPYDTSKRTKDYGVISEYIGKQFTRDEIDKIICELITRHPYIDNAMFLEIHVMWKSNKNGKGYYHSLKFMNYNHRQQTKGSLEIKYEK